MRSTDALIPNTARTKKRLLKELEGTTYEQYGEEYHMSEKQANAISDQLGIEGLDCDWKQKND